MIACTCESCGNELKVPEKYAGQRGKCKRCGETIVVPRCDDPNCPGAAGIPPLRQGVPATRQAPRSTETPATSSAQSTAQNASTEAVAVFVPLEAAPTVDPAAALLENLRIDPEARIVPLHNSDPEPTGLAAFFHPKNKGHLKLMGSGAVLAAVSAVWFGVGLSRGDFPPIPVFLFLAGLLTAMTGLLIKHQAAGKKPS